MRRKPELSRKQQKRLAALAVALLIVFSAAIIVFVGVPLLRFARQPEQFRAWVDQRGFCGRLAFIGMVVLQILVAIIPGEPLEIAAGYAFGALEGTLLCLLAGALGSVAVFFLVRRYGVRLVEVFFSQEKLHSLRFLKSSPARNLLFLIVFMIPGTPKDLLCYFAGLTDLPFGVWLLICSLGRLPSIVTSTIGGSALGTKQYVFAAAVFAATLLISGAGLWLYGRICRRHAQKSPDTAETETKEEQQKSVS